MTHSNTKQLHLSDEMAETVDQSYWPEEAYQAVERLASRRWEFTSEDVVDVVGSAVYDLRVLGQVMLRAERDRIIAQTGRFIQAERPSRHSGPIRIWRSLILGSEV